MSKFPIVNPSKVTIIKGGRVVCPLNGIDTIADVAVENGKVVEIARHIPIGDGNRVDATDCYVVPGIIDAHLHIGSIFGSVWGAHMALRAGVTMGIDMAGPLDDVLHYAPQGGGFQVAVMEMIRTDQVDSEKAMIQSLERGALGMKILGGHFPISKERCNELIRAGHKHNGMVAWHAGSESNGSDILGMREAAEVAEGLPLHLAHINAYCRGRVYDNDTEQQMALDCLQQNPNIFSESYLCQGNATMLDTGANGRILDSVTAMCLRKFGYEPNSNGLEEAILDGTCTVFEPVPYGTIAVNAERGLRAFKNARPYGHGLLGSFKINNLSVQENLAVARRIDGSFAIDALSTDGGCIPRNFIIKKGLCLVEQGLMNMRQFVTKTSLNPARHLRLFNHGHLSKNTVADITIIDKFLKKARGTMIAGRLVMWKDLVVGQGLTFVTTERGKASIQNQGFDTIISDPGIPTPLRLAVY